MAALSPIYKSKCRYALAYGEGTPAGDRARLEKAMNSIPDAYTVGRVQYHIDRVIQAIENSGSDNQTAALDYRELIAGDINRSVSRFRSERSRSRQELISFEAQMLADLLFVPNYRDPTTYAQRFYVEGASYIKAVPGPADTTVGGNIQLAGAYA